MKATNTFFESAVFGQNIEVQSAEAEIDAETANSVLPIFARLLGIDVDH